MSDSSSNERMQQLLRLHNACVEEAWRIGRRGEWVTLQAAQTPDYKQHASAFMNALRAAFAFETVAPPQGCDFAWVIELPGMPTYWDGRGADTFSYKHEQAVRFARKEDAERVLAWVISQQRRDEGARVSEHGWYRDSAPETFSNPCGSDSRPAVAQTTAMEHVAVGKADLEAGTAHRPRTDECDNCGEPRSKHVTDRLICPDTAVPDVYRWSSKKTGERHGE